MTVVPFSLKNAPALIERLLPVQKLSAEAYKEQMAGSGKTLTALGSYWKGRKPLIVNKACILGCLLPATGNVTRDLEIFEKLMAMDNESFSIRWKRRPKPVDILGEISLTRIADYFICDPPNVLPESSPVDFANPVYHGVRVRWRETRIRLPSLYLGVSSIAHSKGVLEKYPWDVAYSLVLSNDAIDCHSHHSSNGNRL